MPRHRIRAKREIIFSVIPETYIKPKAVNIAAGMPTATQKAVFKDKNKKSKIITKSNPVAPFFRSKFSLFDIASALVPDNSISTFFGSVSLIFSKN